PWTEIDPQGSSIFKVRSLKSTPAEARSPAAAPINRAAIDPTNGAPALMAINPASSPLHAIEMSGFPYEQYQNNIAAAAPPTAATLVLMTTRATRPSRSRERR